MASHAATKSADTPEQTDGFGPHEAAAGNRSHFRVEPNAAPQMDLHMARQGARQCGGSVAGARRRLVDALMDAARLRSILSATHSVRRVPVAVSSTTLPLEASDFIGLALTTVAGRSAPAPVRQDPPVGPLPPTPALEALSALFLALDCEGRYPGLQGSTGGRFGAEAFAHELQALGRVAGLSSAGTRAILATASELAALVGELSTIDDLAPVRGLIPGVGMAESPGDPGIPRSPSAGTGLVLGADALDAAIAGTTIGPGGDNLPDAVVLARMFLKLMPVAPGLRPPAAPLTQPIFPAADDAFLRAIGRWRSQDLPPVLRRRMVQGLAAPVTRWSGDLVLLSTLTVGSPEWQALRGAAGCAGQRLRVVTGTAVVLVDRKLGAVRDAVREGIWAMAHDGAAGLAPTACTALTHAAVAFHAATGQTLVPSRLEGGVLHIVADIDWIDPCGRRRSGRDGMAEIADAAPQAAAHILHAARTVLSAEGPPWRLLSGGGPSWGCPLAVRLMDDMPIPDGR